MYYNEGYDYRIVKEYKWTPISKPFRYDSNVMDMFMDGIIDDHMSGNYDRRMIKKFTELVNYDPHKW